MPRGDVRPTLASRRATPAHARVTRDARASRFAQAGAFFGRTNPQRSRAHKRVNRRRRRKREALRPTSSAAARQRITSKTYAKAQTSAPQKSPVVEALTQKRPECRGRVGVSLAWRQGSAARRLEASCGISRPSRPASGRPNRPRYRAQSPTEFEKLVSRSESPTRSPPTPRSRPHRATRHRAGRRRASRAPLRSRCRHHRKRAQSRHLRHRA